MLNTCLATEMKLEKNTLRKGWFRFLDEVQSIMMGTSQEQDCVFMVILNLVKLVIKINHHACC